VRLTRGARRTSAPNHGGVEQLHVFGKDGPETVLRRVRAAEESDPGRVRWPRNKRSDDATLALAVAELSTAVG
jgi:hypothetical protein